MTEIITLPHPFLFGIDFALVCVIGFIIILWRMTSMPPCLARRVWIWAVLIVLMGLLLWSTLEAGGKI